MLTSASVVHVTNMQGYMDVCYQRLWVCNVLPERHLVKFQFETGCPTLSCCTWPRLDFLPAATLAYKKKTKNKVTTFFTFQTTFILHLLQIFFLLVERIAKWNLSLSD